MLAAVSGFRTRMRSEAHDWGVPPLMAEIAFAIPIVGGALLLLTALDEELFESLTSEDGVFEWVTVFGWLLAAALVALAARTLWSRGWRAAAVLYALLALTCVAVVGEELSWGQRLLDVDTPEPIRSRNEQGDLTAHNLAILHIPYRVGMVAVGAYGSLLVYAARHRIAKLWPEGATLFLPPLFLTSTFLVLMLYRGLRLFWLNEPKIFLWGFGEWPELCLGFTMAAFGYIVWRRMLAETLPATSPAEAACPMTPSPTGSGASSRSRV